jgi:GntR family transcriptional regulator
MPDPMYRRIADDLRGMIESGELPRGGLLPSETELRRRYEASRNTVRNAVKWLVARGLVATRPGQGTFVTEEIAPFITQLTGDPIGGREDQSLVFVAEMQTSRREPTSSEMRVEILRATVVTQGELHLPEGAQVVSRQQRRYIDGTPWSLQTSLYPMSLVEQGAVRLIYADNIEEGTVEYLRSGYRDKIIIRAPAAGEAAFFRLPDDGRVSVFEVVRTAYDDVGQPLRLTINVYPADRNQFEVRVGALPSAR